MSTYLPGLLLALGVMLGAALAWLLGRARLAAEIESAVGKAEAVLQSELSVLRERVRAGEAMREEALGWRRELDVLRDEKARLEERSNQVPGLQHSLATAQGDLAKLNEELTGLREAASAETARLHAEREAHALVRDELSREKSVRKGIETQLDTLSQELANVRESTGTDVSRLTAERDAQQRAHVDIRTELEQAKARCDAAEREASRLRSELTKAHTELKSEREGAAEKLAMLVQAREELTHQFKALANDILEEKSKRFAEQNQTSLGQLLDPLKSQLSEFKGKVEEVYVQESKDRSALSEQVRQLMGMNQQLSQEAKNLTQALKGNVKTQGNWGEMILMRVLETAGLQRGREYIVQDSQVREDGSRAQPDVVVLLPQERCLVVDSKVSLNAYESYVSCQTDEERASHLKSHLQSISGHIAGLSGKEYQRLYQGKTLDFVLMFVPIEPAFMLAVMGDESLFMSAWEKNVLLVSPSTLLFVVRTVAHLWRQEAQTRNALDISRRGGELYDRLTDFVADLEKVGVRLRDAQTSYDSAHKRLATQKGNVIRQAQMLRDMGVTPSKSLPPSLVAEATAADEESILAELAGIAASNTPHVPANGAAAASAE